MITSKKFWAAFIVAAVVEILSLALMGSDDVFGKTMLIVFGVSSLCCCSFLGYLIYRMWKAGDFNE